MEDKETVFEMLRYSMLMFVSYYYYKRSMLFCQIRGFLVDHSLLLYNLTNKKQKRKKKKRITTGNFTNCAIIVALLLLRYYNTGTVLTFTETGMILSSNRRK